MELIKTADTRYGGNYDATYTFVGVNPNAYVVFRGPGLDSNNIKVGQAHRGGNWAGWYHEWPSVIRRTIMGLPCGEERSARSPISLLLCNYPESVPRISEQGVASAHLSHWSLLVNRMSSQAWLRRRRTLRSGFWLRWRMCWQRKIWPDQRVR